ncbi:MAG: hypothetical protein ACOYL3_18490 [Desulfuromonadaceae bacterium]
MLELRPSFIALLLVTLIGITACGGGGGSSPQAPSPKIVSIKLFNSGDPKIKLSGSEITLNLPDGVTPALKSDGSTADNVVVISGVAAPGTIIGPVYTPATATTKGTITFAFATSIKAGFSEGEFATIKLRVASEINPPQKDFLLSGYNPIDISYNPVTVLTATLTAQIE